MVSLNVTVMDTQGHYVTDLNQGDFSVFEDGAKQDLTQFNRSNLPIALSLLIDSSASMEQRMQNAQDAAIGFAKKLRPQDLAQVADFDSRVDILSTFTNDVEQLETAIRRTSAGGSTSLYNAIYISLRELKQAPLRVAHPAQQEAAHRGGLVHQLGRADAVLADDPGLAVELLVEQVVAGLAEALVVDPDAIAGPGGEVAHGPDIDPAAASCGLERPRAIEIDIGEA